MDRLSIVIAFVLVFGFVGIVAGCVVALLWSMFAVGTAHYHTEGAVTIDEVRGRLQEPPESWSPLTEVDSHP